ncbi:hypothetical protein BGZ98_007162 [Dissophora globulifera]|nr:hypothetical protein BGZ98_007162 [Dissophora globulifera]
MIAPSLSRLILSASLATIATLLTSAAPITQDPCATLGGLNATELTYDAVANCYRAFTYNSEIATKTLATVRTIFNDYYIFRDSALTPDLQAPFSSAPVDIMNVLDLIGQKKYRSDYEFHNDIYNAVQSLHDAHAGYSVNCYNAYLFAQPLNLYAPVVDGKQSMRVFVDLARRGYEDCEVTTIDGVDALSYIYKWSDSLSYSKDSGVRQNQALATQIFNYESEDFILSSGEFAERATLPENPYVDYVLQCGTTADPIRLRENWRVLPLTGKGFSDMDSYLSNVCYPPKPTEQPSNMYKRELDQPVKRQLFPVARKSALLDATPSPATLPTQGLAQAVQLGHGNATVWYTLKDKPNVGVIVVSTHVAEDAELDIALQGLELFSKANVTNIIIDFQGNTGGSVAFASFLVQLFFPSTSQLDTSLRSDLRVTKSIQDLSTAAFNVSEAGLYDAAGYIDLDTKQTYTNDDLFLQSISLTRNGRQTGYTESTTLQPAILPKIEALASYPWTNQPNNIRILSDGRCGSACALSAHYLHGKYNVAAYSIGGVRGDNLSIFSFAGGAVSALHDINKIYAANKVVSPMENLPYEGDIRVPILEVYADSTDVPLEYDASKYPANYRVDFTPENARSRDVMWTQVATHAWN